MLCDWHDGQHDTEGGNPPDLQPTKPLFARKDHDDLDPEELVVQDATLLVLHHDDGSADDEDTGEPDGVPCLEVHKLRDESDPCDDEDFEGANEGEWAIDVVLVGELI